MEKNLFGSTPNIRPGSIFGSVAVGPMKGSYFGYFLRYMKFMCELFGRVFIIWIFLAPAAQGESYPLKGSYFFGGVLFLWGRGL